MSKSKKKKKKRCLIPRRKRMKRPARLSSAKHWIPKYSGKNIVAGYANWYGVGLLCAIQELRMLGVEVSEEYETKVRASVEQKIEARRQAKAKKREEELAWQYEELYGIIYDPDDMSECWGDLPL